jgi:hypothetical protein
VIFTKVACDGDGLHCDSSFPGSLPTAAAACCYDGFHIKIDSLYNINVNLQPPLTLSSFGVNILLSAVSQTFSLY